MLTEAEQRMLSGFRFALNVKCSDPRIRRYLEAKIAELESKQEASRER